MKPILLLGSAFDAFTLGKWIFDWTVSQYSADSPMAKIAGDVWTSFIQLACKMDRADKCRPLVRRESDRDTLCTVIKNGRSIWRRFENLLKRCERAMLETAKESGGKLRLDADAGRAFVENMFGIRHDLDETEAVRSNLHRWVMGFDELCGPLVLKYLGK